jgi:ribose transport system substrate-binding protein
MRTTTFLAMLALAVGLTGCSGSSPTAAEAPAGDKKLRIAVIPKGSTHEFWKAVHAGADEAGSELGVEVIWKGPLKEDDRDDQIKVVENFTTNKVDGIVLAPLDDTALRGPVDEAIKSGIPVLIIDSALKGEGPVSFVATDNRHGGEMAGEEMVKLLGGKGRVVVLRYQEGSASTTEREEGFLEVMKKNPGIQVISDNQYAGATVETAQAKAESVLSGFKNTDGSLAVDGVFAPNESSTFGTLRVLQDSNWAGKVKFVGFDSSQKLVDGLLADQINALVVQDPHKMGYLGVKTLMAHLKKESIQARIDTGAVLVSKETMKDPAIAALIGVK